MKPIAIVVDVVLLTTILVLVGLGSDPFEVRIGSLGVLLAIVVVAIDALSMLCLVTERWVKTTADAYARQLLAACDVL